MKSLLVLIAFTGSVAQAEIRVGDNLQYKQVNAYGCEGKSITDTRTRTVTNIDSVNGETWVTERVSITWDDGQTTDSTQTTNADYVDGRELATPEGLKKFCSKINGKIEELQTNLGKMSTCLRISQFQDFIYKTWYGPVAFGEVKTSMWMRDPNCRSAESVTEVIFSHFAP
jgi:hypothetical protein